MVPCTGIAHCQSVCVCYSRGSVQFGSARVQETEDVRTDMICKNKRASHNLHSNALVNGDYCD